MRVQQLRPRVRRQLLHLARRQDRLRLRDSAAVPVGRQQSDGVRFFMYASDPEADRQAPRKPASGVDCGGHGVADPTFHNGDRDSCRARSALSEEPGSRGGPPAAASSGDISPPGRGRGGRYPQANTPGMLVCRLSSTTGPFVTGDSATPMPRESSFFRDQAAGQQQCVAVIVDLSVPGIGLAVGGRPQRASRR